jgi:predicted RecB family nuclease
MSKTITCEILVAYSQCARKAYLLLCTREKGTPHEYVTILEQQRQATQQKYLNILRRKNVDVQSYNPDKLTGKHEFLTNVTLEANGLAAECAILNKVRTHSALGRYSYEPTIFVGTHSIKKEQKLELFFVSRVLDQVQSKPPVSGRIIGPPVELFLDIEGVPDRQFYYLIGLLVSENDTTAYHSFWADTSADEARMWQQFLAKASQYPEAPIYHYGSFEPRALTKLARRYDTDADSLTEQLVNVNKHIFGKAYFPVYSNRLKEIGAFIGASWSSPEASGLQSLVWRYHWDETHSDKYKDRLLTYNKEDCQALILLTDEISKIKYSADTLSDVDFANRPKFKATEVGNQIHNQFETILRFSYN